MRFVCAFAVLFISASNLIGDEKIKPYDISVNEWITIANLKRIVLAQVTWYRGKGRKNYNSESLRRFYYEKDKNGKLFKLIPETLADADLFGKKKPLNGYLYGAVQKDENGNEYVKTNYKYAFFAIPYKYGKTGIHTFVLNDEGVIYCENIHVPKAIEIFPGQDPSASGWKLASETIRSPSEVRKNPGGEKTWDIQKTERNAVSATKLLATANLTWRMIRNYRKKVKMYNVTSIRDFYFAKDDTGEKLRLIYLPLAKADASGDSVPNEGYLYDVLKNDEEGIPYVNISDKKFGFIAYPSEYGISGKKTFVINQNRKIYSRDLKGEKIDQFPENLEKSGWELEN